VSPSSRPYAEHLHPVADPDLDALYQRDEADDSSLRAAVPVLDAVDRALELPATPAPPADPAPLTGGKLALANVQAAQATGAALIEQIDEAIRALNREPAQWALPMVAELYATREALKPVLRKLNRAAGALLKEIA
jgi:hypothetical protein